MTKQKTLSLLFLFIAIMAVALSLGFAQAAPAAENSHLVTGFNAFSTNGTLSDLTIHVMETDQYGRLITARAVNENNHFLRVHRYLINGELDPSFGTNGRANIAIPNLNYKLYVKAIGFQNDGSGKILIAASQDIGNNGSFDFTVVRLTADGKLDTTFNILPKTFSGDSDFQGLDDMVIQDDNKIVLVGSVPDCGSIRCDSDFGVVRYNPDGTFDQSFAGDGFTRIDLIGDEDVNNVELLDDGRIVFFGRRYKGVEDVIFAAGRLMPDGSPDRSFDQDGVVGHDFVSGNGVVFGDGTMAVTGFSQGVVKLNADGSIDNSFGTDGFLDVSATGIKFVQAVLGYSDKSLLVAGFSSEGGSHTRVAKYLANGTLDVRFGETGHARFPGIGVRHLTFANDGRILMLVDLPGNDHEKALFRILPNGMRDRGGWVTNNITPLDDSINDMVIQPNGKIVAIGNILDTGMGLARYNPDGSFDTDFGFGRGYLTNGTPRNYGLATAVDSANRIIAVRGIVDVDDGINFKAPRYQPNGSLSLWPTGRPINGMIGNWGGVTDFATEIELYPDESFAVIGSSDGEIAVTRYTSGGALDTSYGVGDTGTTKARPAGYAFAGGSALQSDGKLIITGSVANKVFIIRLKTDGAYDPTFKDNGLVVLDIPNSVRESFNDVVVLPNGQILAVGSMSNGGKTDMLAMRFNSDGSPDRTFFDAGRLQLGVNGDAFLNAVTLDQDGSIMMAGCVEETVGHFAVVRLEPNGSIEFDFGDDGVLILDETPTMGRACAQAIVRDDNTGEFVLAGYTTNTEGRQQFALARIKTNMPPSTPTPTPTTDPTTTPEPSVTPEPDSNNSIYLPLVVK